mmetsp:Transcript_36369/g.91488  ORF Transcript_36369/g.91488 Transcript_36369/m.91488 type:complete len:104 (-) Transcript_36369:121-432(-)
MGCIAPVDLSTHSKWDQHDYTSLVFFGLMGLVVDAPRAAREANSRTICEHLPKTFCMDSVRIGTLYLSAVREARTFVVDTPPDPERSHVGGGSMKPFWVMNYR